MKIVKIVLSVALAGLCSVSVAQSYPSQPIRWIVPYAAGGGTDVIARTIADAMKAGLGQNIVIDNRPGGATNIANEMLATAKPDGHTVMSAENAALAFNEHLFKKLNFNPEKDFSYIGTFGRFPLVLVVHPDFPVKTMPELVDYAKKNPGKLNYASPGNGSPHHVGMELLKQAAGIEMTHLPYRGAAPAMQDLMAGQVPVMLLDLASGLPIMRSGKVRLLAVGTAQRAKALPDVPTLAEAGIKGVDVFAFQGMVAPAGIPSEAATKLASELRRALQDPNVVRKFEDFGIEPLSISGDAFKRLARSEAARWGEVIRRAKISLD